MLRTEENLHFSFSQKWKQKKNTNIFKKRFQKKRNKTKRLKNLKINPVDFILLFNYRKIFFSCPEGFLANNGLLSGPATWVLWRLLYHPPRNSTWNIYLQVNKDRVFLKCILLHVLSKTMRSIAHKVYRQHYLHTCVVFQKKKQVARLKFN